MEKILAVPQKNVQTVDIQYQESKKEIQSTSKHQKRKKEYYGKFLFLLLLVVLLVLYSHTVVSNDISKAEQETSAIATDATESEANMIDVDISDCHVKYLRHEIANNMAGEKCLVIYYEFTNNSKDNKAFDYTISDKAFQGGVELQSSLFHVNDESKDSGAEIQPGTTITVASGFLLRDESDVQLEVNAYISFSSKPKGSMTLTLMQ